MAKAACHVVRSDDSNLVRCRGRHPHSLLCCQVEVIPQGLFVARFLRRGGS